jgi:nitrate/TMAO reductase-like tetraheme cytochrome c subunit
MDPVGGLGVLFATFGGVLFVTLVGLSILGFPFNTYMGILIWIGLPAILLIGLVLIPIGRWRLARTSPGGKMPELDFDNPVHLRKLGVFLAISLVNIILFGFAGYGAYHYSESNEFCGITCHTVMEPEYTAYQLSPHARVKCVDCHIGEGADWFVRSKLSGARQVLAVMTGSYHRPIETPIANLRPARETCEQCHWPEKFHGDKLTQLTVFEDDEENTETQTVLLLKVGGTPKSGDPHGIHWHIHPSVTVEYISTDHTRQEIPWVRLEREDGTVEEFVADGMDEEELAELMATGQRRVMDCMDCHNRPTHTFEPAEAAVDHALADGRLDKTVPWMKRSAVRALQAEVASGEDPSPRIRAALEEAFGAKDALPGEAVLTATTAELREIWGHNVFPRMDITWGTYPHFLGHQDDGGCFRCHDDGHTSTTTGDTISGDCENCHSLLAWEEEEPEILDALYGTQ